MSASAAAESNATIEELKALLELARKENQGKDAAINALRNELQSQSISYWMKRGLPKLDRKIFGSAHGSGITKNHEPATLTESTFPVLNCVTDYFDCSHASCLLPNLSKDGTYSFSSESDLQFLIRLALNDIIRAANLKDQITLNNEVSLDGCRPDIWVLEVQDELHHPVCAVEVKQPNEKGLSDPHVLGQMYDYLDQLRIVHNRKDIFGILTNYHSWRVVWLHGSSLAFDNGSEQKDNGDVNGLTEQFATVSLEGNADRMTDQDVDITYGRHMMGTEIFPYDHKDLLHILLSLVQRLSLIKYDVNSLEMTGKKRFFKLLAPDTSSWHEVEFPTFSLRCPHGNTTNLLLLYDYGRGADGRAWLACSKTGELIVLKFLTGLSDEGATQRADEESRMWNILYEAKARALTLVCRSVVAMPFVFTTRPDPNSPRGLKFEATLSPKRDTSAPQFSQDVRSLSQVQPEMMAREAVETIVSKGYIHEDVHWRHVGAMPEFSEDNCTVLSFRGVFIDLTRVSKYTSLGLTREEAKAHMLSALGLKC